MNSLKWKKGKKNIINKDIIKSRSNFPTDRVYKRHLKKEIKEIEKTRLYTLSKLDNSLMEKLCPKHIIKINWSFLFHKRFFLNNFYEKEKKRYALFSFRLKKKILLFFSNKVIYSFYYKLKFFNKFCILNFIGRGKNVFLNYSHYNGDIIKHFSGGMYYKGSLKKSYYAINAIIFRSMLPTKYLYLKKDYIIYIWSRFKDYKLKKNLRDFIKEKKKYNIVLLNYIKVRCHNGIRSRKATRK